MSSLPPPSEGRVYRPGATIVPLFFWAVLTGISAGLLIHLLLNPPAGFEARGLALLMTVFAILFGPVAFFVHLIRFCVVWVSIDPKQGLRFSSGRTVPWEEIRSVEHKAAAFKGLLRPSLSMFLISMGCWAVIYFVVLPSFALFTPWHTRVIVGLKSGERVILRDLGSADNFAAELSREIQVRQPAS